MKKFLILILFAGLISLTGCTENTRAKNWGGSVNVTLPPGTKLVTATFKEANLWYLVRPMHENESPEMSVFQEQSNFGVYNGRIIFNESRKQSQ